MYFRPLSAVIVLSVLSDILVVADMPAFMQDQAVDVGAYGNLLHQSFLSDPSVTGLVANIHVPPQHGASPSRHIGWASQGFSAGARPMLIDANTFSTVWSGPALSKAVWSPTVQSCNGTDYLTWWGGATDPHDSTRRGRVLMANRRYELVYNISALDPVPTVDVHELFVTPYCSVVVFGIAVHQHDLTAYNITDGWIEDPFIQEIDLATGSSVFLWQTSKHVPEVISETQWTLHDEVGKSAHAPFDCSRHTCTIYYISATNGTILWRLGGSNSDFKDISGGKALDFHWQHHARWVDEDLRRISLFDNHIADPRSFPSSDQKALSRGLILELDHERREVRLVHSYLATGNIHAYREGSMQVLTDSPTPGNVLLGYGHEPAFTEFSADGTVLLDVAFGPRGLSEGTSDNYRVLKVNWTGSPSWGPKIAPGPRPEYTFNNDTATFAVTLLGGSGDSLANDTAYFSWNGATEVASWVVLASNDTVNLTLKHFLGEALKTGFEDHLGIGSFNYIPAHFSAGKSLDLY
ncbi:hypothetical protein K461DRAFT_268232 [Myriangium duriaei CBS 260.36]|uniref:ASST-domain-containing protein n=1 Tax=Myriangium duriaei CBS 260.36 TaxID=1168546 RepID=A0A9P4IZ53_9PEZI|nr:hypothetical protein K461DRAFT_268232 [Myriangium duriaei CBS 260.36]